MLLSFSAVTAGDHTEALGYYNDGKLKNGESILERRVNIHKLFRSRKRAYGTQKLIDLVASIADEATSRFKMNKLQVGDLSDKDGGSAKPVHASHQNGLDVDIVYLERKEKLQKTDEATWEEWFVYKGKVTNNFNPYRNWEIFKYIVNQGGVSRIFVDPAVKKSVCDFATKMGEKNENAHVLRRLRPTSKHHKTHFHLRLKCPADDSGCIDQAEPPAGHGCDNL
jgi:penicillin-insensitive murein endopeptidase